MESQEEILKGALLLEQRGKAFYENAARSATHPGVGDLFARLAEEEDRHIQILSKAFADFVRSGKIRTPSWESKAVDAVGAVLTEDLKRQVDNAAYEAAAIYAGIALEEKAAAFYAHQAQRTTGEAKDLYEKLAAWERTHLELLMALDQDLRQRIWHDQRFWPMY